MSDAKNIRTLADADFKLLQLRKRLDELPQRAQILATRKQISEFQEKAQQIAQMQTQTQQKLTLLADEQALLRRKIDAAQKKLDSGTAYKETTALTREIEGHAKQISRLEDEELEAMEKAEKISSVGAQTAGAVEKLGEQERALTEAYQEQGGALQGAIGQLEKARVAALSQLSSAVVQRYEKALAAKGGIAAAVLEGDHCSACHVSFAEGQLMRLKAGAAAATIGEGIAECPHCHRLLVV